MRAVLNRWREPRTALPAPPGGGRETLELWQLRLEHRVLALESALRSQNRLLLLALLALVGDIASKWLMK